MSNSTCTSTSSSAATAPTTPASRETSQCEYATTTEASVRPVHGFHYAHLHVSEYIIVVRPGQPGNDVT